MEKKQQLQQKNNYTVTYPQFIVCSSTRLDKKFRPCFKFDLNEQNEKVNRKTVPQPLQRAATECRVLRKQVALYAMPPDEKYLYKIYKFI
jgi:hypothetical protein